MNKGRSVLLGGLTAMLVVIAIPVAAYATFLPGYAMWFNLFDKPGNLIAAAVFAAGACVVPAASARAAVIGRRRGDACEPLVRRVALVTLIAAVAMLHAYMWAYMLALALT